MNTCRKFWQRSKRQVCAALFMISLISPAFAMFASAADISYIGDGFGYWWSYGLNNGADGAWKKNEYSALLPREDEFTPVSVAGFSPSNATYDKIGCQFNEFTINSDTGFKRRVDVYLTWFYASNIEGTWELGMLDFQYDQFNWILEDENGNELTYTTKTNFFDVPAEKMTNWDSWSKGFMVALSIDVPGNSRIIKIKSAGLYDYARFNTSQECYVYLFMPTAYVLSADTSGESVLDDIYYQFEEWNDVSEIPAAVVSKTNKAQQVIQDINSLVKPDPGEIVPSLDTDTGDISFILEPFFSNALIVQLCTMVLGFAFVSYVLFGKKG